MTEEGTHTSLVHRDDFLYILALMNSLVRLKLCKSVYRDYVDPREWVVLDDTRVVKGHKVCKLIVVT